MSDSVALLDTSVVIALEASRPMRTELLPDVAVLSVVTLAELEAGVLAAPNDTVRSRRMATLADLADVEVLPIDAAAASVWALLRTHLAREGRRANVNDLWIAASAASRDLAVITQDGDFDAVDGVAGLRIVRV